MKFFISGPNARTISKAIHSLVKVGTDVFFEADKDGIAMRTVNSSNSAFLQFKFLPGFFSNVIVETNETEVKCRVSIKACLGIFKNMRQVELCIISINQSSLKLIVELKCKLETIKIHLVSILELESLQAVYITENVPNNLTTTHKLFTEILNNFQINEEEITFECYQDKFIAKNYIEGSEPDRKLMRSQLTLKPEEFNEYVIKEETFITFCIREFRAFLSFVEAVNLDLSVNFETAGKPVVFLMKNIDFFEVTLVMSTVSADDVATGNSNETNDIEMIISINSPGRNNSDEEELPKAKKRRKNRVESLDENELNINTNTDTEIESIENPRVNSNIEDGISIIFQDTEDLDDGMIGSSRQNRNNLHSIFKGCFEATLTPRSNQSNEILAKNSDSED